MAARPETAARPAQGKEEPRVRTIKKNATPGVAWKVRADHAQTSQRHPPTEIQYSRRAVRSQSIQNCEDLLGKCWKCHSCQEPLKRKSGRRYFQAASSPFGSFLGRPRERSEASRPSLNAVLRTHFSLP